jgi:hypothetical protein
MFRRSDESTEFPRNKHHRQPKIGHQCSIIKSKAIMQNSLYDENTKRNS